MERLITPYFSIYPGGEAAYARNPWDLHAFDGRLYIGAGNSANRGPAPNAGPVPLFSWDPRRRAFRHELVVDDEQLERFVTLGDTLFVPGHDARESWEWGNLYRREARGEWRKLRRVPRAVHLYDLALHRGRLYAALGAFDLSSDHGGSAVALSEDGGERWRTVDLGGLRAYLLMESAGRLYAVDVVGGEPLRRRLGERGRLAGYAPVYELEGVERFRPRPDLDRAALFPATELKRRAAKVTRALNLDGRLLYLGGYVHNDHQSRPFGAYLADSLTEGAVRVRRIELPEGAWPADLLARDGRVRLLLNRPLEQGGYRISLWESRDLERWREPLHLIAPTFARSFEYLDGDLYIGLGGEIASPRDWRAEEIHPATGVLLRIDGKHLLPPNP